ncbi:MAG: PaaI family thioesterase [Microthrixaceae bacterium]
MELDKLVASMPFAVATGVELIRAEPGQVQGRLAWSSQICTIGESIHGGALMTLADSVGAICAFLNLPDGAATSTIESKTNFFRGLSSGYANCVSRPLHVGRRTVVIETDVRDDQDRRLSLTIQTQAVLL